MDGPVPESSAQVHLTDYGLPAGCDLRLFPGDRSVGFQLGGIFPPGLYRDAFEVSSVDDPSSLLEKLKLSCMRF
jgi:hypothetical protein